MFNSNGCPVRKRTSALVTNSDQWRLRIHQRHQLSKESIFLDKVAVAALIIDQRRRYYSVNPSELSRHLIASSGFNGSGQVGIHCARSIFYVQIFCCRFLLFLTEYHLLFLIAGLLLFHILTSNELLFCES